MLPPGITGIELYYHQIDYHQRMYTKKENEHKISAYLDCPINGAHQEALVSVRGHLKMQDTLMDNVNVVTSLQKAAQVRLDNLAQNRSCYMFINDPDRLGWLNDWLELHRSLGDIEDATKC